MRCNGATLTLRVQYYDIDDLFYHQILTDSLPPPLQGALFRGTGYATHHVETMRSEKRGKYSVEIFRLNQIG